ncbi:MAG: FAD-binding and (Fe-S)-binding domain-containing protein [Gemmatimonadaceae bacterium]
MDPGRLERDLRLAIAGDVRFDAGSRALYATDASNYRQVPIGVVLPRSADDVVAAVAVCRAHDAPVLPRGGGTSLAGQCCNVAVVLDFTKYLGGVIEIDAAGKLARVHAGCVLDQLNNAAAHHNLRFGPDPATHTHCTLGGMIGNNSCGVHSVIAGRTSANVAALEVLTYRGERLHVSATPNEELTQITAGDGVRARIYGKLVALRDRYAALIRARFPPAPRRSSGFALEYLLPENGFNVARALVGTEATCVTVLEATLRLIPWPRARVLVVLGYPDVFRAADDVPFVLQFEPMALEGMDAVLVDNMRKKRLHQEEVALLPNGNGWLLAEFGGDSVAQARDAAARLIAALERRGSPPAMRLFDDPRAEERVWRTRESGLGATAFVPGEGDTWEGWEDAAVPPERMGEYLRAFSGLLDAHGYRTALYGHFGDGCLHCRINFDLVTTQGIARYRRFAEAAADLVVRFGGSLSGEHGDGQSRGELLERMFGPELVQAFREFKEIWDPDWKMNPGKVVAPARLDENLRLGASYAPAEPATHFRFPADNGQFSRAVLRCVGVGACRKLERGTMCPSYMATRDEQHSTRGRAHLLFEMLRGEVIAGGWRNEAVHEALDLCLACKACRSECPVSVDVATYKAEFLAHYYEGRRRPAAAYALGLIDVWGRLAARAPGLANALIGSRATAAMAQRFGIVRQRRIPHIAAQSFQRWFARRSARDGGSRPGGGNGTVILWPDTFSNYFEPAVAQAAVAVLERAGLRVVVPAASLCCGRPLYDFGMLVRAKRLLRRCLDALRPHIRRGTPLVVLEPSCGAVFRDELPNLFPDDPDAPALRDQTYLLGGFLASAVSGYQPPSLGAHALVQPHCHHKAVFGFQHDERLLQAAGLRAEILDAGCCGLAGSFGYEERHYGISMTLGERVLFPAARTAPPDTLIIADGFSCRSQIRHGTARTAIHLAQALNLAPAADAQ